MGKFKIINRLAKLIRGETLPEANTKERVGQALEEISNWKVGEYDPDGSYLQNAYVIYKGVLVQATDDVNEKESPDSHPKKWAKKIVLTKEELSVNNLLPLSAGVLAQVLSDIEKGSMKEIRAATDTIAGIVKRATAEKVNKGTDNDSFITPLFLKVAIDSIKDLLLGLTWTDVLTSRPEANITEEDIQANSFNRPNTQAKKVITHVAIWELNTADNVVTERIERVAWSDFIALVKKDIGTVIVDPPNKPHANAVILTLEKQVSTVVVKPHANSIIGQLFKQKAKVVVQPPFVNKVTTLSIFGGSVGNEGTYQQQDVWAFFADGNSLIVTAECQLYYEADKGVVWGSDGNFVVQENDIAGDDRATLLTAKYTFNGIEYTTTKIINIYDKSVVLPKYSHSYIKVSGPLYEASNITAQVIDVYSDNREVAYSGPGTISLVGQYPDGMGISGTRDGGVTIGLPDNTISADFTLPDVLKFTTEGRADIRGAISFINVNSGVNHAPVMNFKTLFITAYEDHWFESPYVFSRSKFTDPDNDPLTASLFYSTDGVNFGPLPNWITFDVSAWSLNVFGPLPSSGNDRQYFIRLYVDDKRGGSVYDDIALIVAGDNYARDYTNTTVTASSTYAGFNFSPSYVIDGVYRPLQVGEGNYAHPAKTPGGWGQGEGWQNAEGTNAIGQWLEFTFDRQRQVSYATVWSLGDDFMNPNDSNPYFDQTGITAYSIQMPNGSGGWTTLASLANIQTVRTEVQFPTVQTNKLRLLIEGTADGNARVMQVTFNNQKQ